MLLIFLFDYNLKIIYSVKTIVSLFDWTFDQKGEFCVYLVADSYSRKTLMYVCM